VTISTTSIGEADITSITPSRRAVSPGVLLGIGMLGIARYPYSRDSPKFLVVSIVRITHMSQANKRIPVTEDRWRELNDIKQAGQTYDELLKELIQERNRRQLAERARRVEEADRQDLTPLDEL